MSVKDPARGVPLAASIWRLLRAVTPRASLLGPAPAMGGDARRRLTYWVPLQAIVSSRAPQVVHLRVIACRKGSVRLLLLNYEYPPLGGGAGVATAALAEHLARRGDEVDVLTTRIDSRRWPLVTHERPPAFDGALRIHRVPSWRRGVHQAGIEGAGGYVAAAFAALRTVLGPQRCDVVHVFFSLPTGVLLLSPRLRGLPVVVSLRGSDVPGYDRRKRRLEALHRLLRPLSRWIWRRADRVVVVCESLGELARGTLPTLAYDVVRNGVDLELFRPGPLEPGRPPRPVRCLAVARLVDRKGLDDLLHAFALLDAQDFTLEIVGSGPSEQALRQTAERLQLGNRVRFTGSLDRKRTAERYREADLFTLAPLEEAFGNVFAEALAAGLPIVGSDVGGIPELVEHGVNGLLVPPQQPAALATAIRTLAADVQGRAEMRGRNRAKAEATLSWETMAARYATIYEDIRRERARSQGRRPRGVEVAS